MKTHDLIVVGAGPGGYETAATAARLGEKVLLVERDELGGTCLNRGCIPTKALCRSAEIADLVGEAARFGIGANAPAVDFEAVIARKNDVVAALREGVATVLKDVEVVKGEAVFADSHTVEVNGSKYSAPKIIVATGSAPSTLDIPGKELAVNSDYLLSMERLPESVVIIGGGVIGMEFASILRSFGVEVTVLEYCRQILPALDEEVAKRLRMALKRRGITIVTSAKVVGVEPGMRVRYIEKEKEKSVGCEMVVMAVGRRPVIPAGLVDLGLELERGFVKTDSAMATNLEGVYAIGDVNGRCMLAHAATAQGRVALGLEKEPSVVPAAVFTRPECAMAGVTEAGAQIAGMDMAVGKAYYRANGKAMAMGEADGMVKIVIDRGADRIAGIHVCGAHAADLVQEVASAMACGVSPESLRQAVHIHPTLSELVESALIDSGY